MRFLHYLLLSGSRFLLTRLLFCLGRRGKAITSCHVRNKPDGSIRPQNLVLASYTGRTDRCGGLRSSPGRVRLDASSLSNNVDGGRTENIFKDYRTKKILADVSISSQTIRLLALLALFPERMPLLSDNQAHDQTTTSATLSSVVICPLSQLARYNGFPKLSFNLIWYG